MKNIKKFLSLLLVLAMVFAMSSSVFATGSHFVWHSHGFRYL